MVQINQWIVPDKLFNRYIRLIKYTEHTGTRYNYEFDERRAVVHNEILTHLNLMPHMEEYRNFQKAIDYYISELLFD